MKSPSPLSAHVDETAITGLREVAVPLDATVHALRGPPSSTSVRSSPPDNWEVDDTPESELPVPEGELLGGRYLIERKFAEGGMGIVCLGRHAQLQQPVAIKFLRRALAGKPSVVERFLNEARALAQLRSEHVVRVMDVGQLDSGRPYLVMEHLDGVDLDTLVDRDGPLSVETAVSYVLQVCEPLAEAHALGIVHRDIKPENLFLWTGGPSADIVKVLDFGVAKQINAPRALAVTGPQDSIGSPCYMSPEQITAPQSVDARTDVWSLGVVLYRLLSDSLPFDGGNLLEVLSHVLSAEPKPLAQAVPNIDPELEAIVHRCLEKGREARFSSMNELSEALSAYLQRRQAGALPKPSSPPVTGEAVAWQAAEPDANEKIRIPGVHARWPGVLAVLLVLSAAAAYQANRLGYVHLRELTDGRLTPARLSADAPARPFEGRFELPSSMARGVYAAEPVRGADGKLSLRAEPEVERADSDASTEPDDAPISELERVRRIAAYRAYLKSEGLTPLHEALPGAEPAPPAAEAPSAPATPEPAPTTDDPYQ